MTGRDLTQEADMWDVGGAIGSLLQKVYTLYKLALLYSLNFRVTAGQLYHFGTHR